MATNHALLFIFDGPREGRDSHAITGTYERTSICLDSPVWPQLTTNALTGGAAYLALLTP